MTGSINTELTQRNNQQSVQERNVSITVLVPS